LISFYRQGVSNMMKYLAINVLIALCVSSSFAADKLDLPARIAVLKASTEEVAAKVGNYPQALIEIEKARLSLKKAEQAYDKGRQWMGLGGVKPEAEQEVRHNLLMVEMAMNLASSRAAKGRNEEEAASLEKQLILLKGRVKVLEDRKQEEDKLRKTVQACEVNSKELATLKADQSKFSTQIEQLTADKKKLEAQNVELATEKAALAMQLDALKKTPPAPVPAPAEAPQLSPPSAAK